MQLLDSLAIGRSDPGRLRGPPSRQCGGLRELPSCTCACVRAQPVLPRGEGDSLLIKGRLPKIAVALLIKGRSPHSHSMIVIDCVIIPG